MTTGRINQIAVVRTCATQHTRIPGERRHPISRAGASSLSEAGVQYITHIRPPRDRVRTQTQGQPQIGCIQKAREKKRARKKHHALATWDGEPRSQCIEMHRDEAHLGAYCSPCRIQTPRPFGSSRHPRNSTHRGVRQSATGLQRLGTQGGTKRWPSAYHHTSAGREARGDACLVLL